MISKALVISNIINFDIRCNIGEAENNFFVRIKILSLLFFVHQYPYKNLFLLISIFHWHSQWFTVFIKHPNQMYLAHKIYRNIVTVTENAIFLNLSGKHSSWAIRFIARIIKIPCVTSIPEKHAPGEEKEKSWQRMLGWGGGKINGERSHQIH